MFPTKLELNNRYGDRNYLELVDHFSDVNDNTFGKYRLVMEYDIPLRTGIDRGKVFIDPSGGPLIREGYTLGNLEVIDVQVNKDNIYVDMIYTEGLM